MIQNFDATRNISNTSNFQSRIIDRLDSLFEKINTTNLNEASYIDATENNVIISLVHKDDEDSIITVNIHRDHISLWISECNMDFD